jgi:hypothetical protein
VPGLNPAHGLWRVGETGPHAVAQWHAAHGQSRPNPVVLTARNAGATLWVRSRVDRGLTGGSLTVGSRVRGGGRGVPGKVGNGAAHRGGRASVGWRRETGATTF